MKPEIEQVLKELEMFGREHDAAESLHANRMLNLEPDTARLLHLLLCLGQCRSVLEVGTSNGYSTIWIADAMEANGGSVISIERSEEKQTKARANLGRAGLLHRVDLRLGDATEIIGELDAQFDAIFFDADRVSAPAQLQLLRKKMAPRVLLLADNVLSHPEEISGYLKAVSALEGFDRQIVPVGKGLSITSRI